MGMVTEGISGDPVTERLSGSHCSATLQTVIINTIKN